MMPLTHDQGSNLKYIWHSNTGYDGPNGLYYTFLDSHEFAVNTLGFTPVAVFDRWSPSGRFYIKNDGRFEDSNALWRNFCDLTYGESGIVTPLPNAGSLLEYFDASNHTLNHNDGFSWLQSDDKYCYVYAEDLFGDPSHGIYLYQYEDSLGRFDLKTPRKDSGITWGRYATGHLHIGVNDSHNFDVTENHIVISGTVYTANGYAAAQSHHMRICDRLTGALVHSLYPKTEQNEFALGSPGKCIQMYMSPDETRMAVSCKNSQLDSRNTSLRIYPWVIDIWDTSNADPTLWTKIYQVPYDNGTSQANAMPWWNNVFWLLQWSPDSRWLIASHNGLDVQTERGLRVFDRQNSWLEVDLNVGAIRPNIVAWRPHFNSSSTAMVAMNGATSTVGGYNYSPVVWTVNPTAGGAWTYTILPHIETSFQSGSTSAHTFVPDFVRTRM